MKRRSNLIERMRLTDPKDSAFCSKRFEFYLFVLQSNVLRKLHAFLSRFLQFNRVGLFLEWTSGLKNWNSQTMKINMRCSFQKELFLTKNK